MAPAKYMLFVGVCVLSVSVCVCGKFKFICVALKWAEDATRKPKP